MIEPFTPSSTGGVPAGLRTKPASNSPTKVMNSPMPIEMPTRRDRGTALNTAVRNPVSTSSAISTPSITISPIACGQVICGAMVKASRAFSPSPAAMPIGNRPMTPIRMVITPATRAVAAATFVMVWSTLAPTTAPAASAYGSPPTRFPRLSGAVPMINGLRAMMYAIVKKVTMPPRISRPIVEPRAVMPK